MAKQISTSDNGSILSSCNHIRSHYPLSIYYRQKHNRCQVGRFTPLKRFRKYKNGYSSFYLSKLWFFLQKTYESFQFFLKRKDKRLCVSGKLYYNKYKNQDQSKQNLIEMFYYTLPNASHLINDIYFCFLPNSYAYPHVLNNHQNQSPVNIQTLNYTLLSTQQQNDSAASNKQTLASLKTEVSDNIQGQIELSSQDKLCSFSLRTYKKSKKLGIDEIKLNFRTQWKNQNRNIVPNLVNQMMSFILKKNKSSKLISKLFSHYPHASTWTPNKFYLYMKKIKDSVSHYVNQSIIQYFFQTHEPKCEIYSQEQQQFYMKLCRIAILSFLRSDVIIISLTSSRMSEAKRKTHLVAREALLNKFLELARN